MNQGSWASDALLGGVNTALSFGEIPWFDDQGEIRRCDWLKRTRSLEMCTWRIPKNAFFDQSQRRISPSSSNHGISPNDSVNDSG